MQCLGNDLRGKKKREEKKENTYFSFYINTAEYCGGQKFKLVQKNLQMGKWISDLKVSLGDKILDANRGYSLTTAYQKLKSYIQGEVNIILTFLPSLFSKLLLHWAAVEQDVRWILKMGKYRTTYYAEIVKI